MKTCAIIAEYNPFHNGHLYQLNKAKEISKADNIIVVMSGNFVQRGEPAIYDKYIRTKMALENGADLVIELPVYFSTASAEHFAQAAINILEYSGICDYICFGAEYDDIEAFFGIADLLLNESIKYKSVLKQQLKNGFSFPIARSIAISETLDKDYKDILNQPNNILAIEYIKALKRVQSSIKPIFIKRKNAHYHSIDINNNISSATAIRNLILDNDLITSENYSILKNIMPSESFRILVDSFNKNITPNQIDNFSKIFQFIIRTQNIDYVKLIYDINEGLENRILEYSSDYYIISDIITNIKTKRYPFTKLQRDILHIILNITKSDFHYFAQNKYSEYIRVLGFRSDKSQLLLHLTNNSSLPIIINLKKASNILSKEGMRMLEKEIQSTDIYNLGLKYMRGHKYEYRVPIIKV